MQPITRRSLLAGGLAVAAAGVGAAAGWITSPGRDPVPPPAAPRSPVLEAELIRVRSLQDRIDATIAAQSPFAAALTVVRDDHAAHIEALVGLLRADGVVVTSPASSAAASAVASSSTSGSGPSGSVGPPPFTTGAEIGTAEATNARAVAAASLALTGAAAATLASMSACCSGHAVLVQ